MREQALAMKPFTAGVFGEYFVARTGYTGEDGWEIIGDADAVVSAWQALADAGVQPCGLGARDTLRLEAGLNLYGSDMDETTTPLESNLGWTVAFEPPERDFIGRAALERQKEAGVPRRLVGLVLEGRGVLRNHQPVLAGEDEVGEITSGGFGPTVGGSIALARIGADAEEPLEVDVRACRCGSSDRRSCATARCASDSGRLPALTAREHSRQTASGRGPAWEDREMSEVPGDLKYTKDHEWIRIEDDGSVTLGITDHAQESLGDLVFVELPEQGDSPGAGDGIAVVESVKAASDVYAPFECTVDEVNGTLADEPEKVNSDPYGDGWIARLTPASPAALDDLLDAEAYEQLLAEAED
jgi:glycine cleavage system H protein